MSLRVPSALAAVALVAVMSAVPILGQEEVIAFGDSITEGPNWADEEKKGGYPSRLEDLLQESGIVDAKVHNEGRSTERTAEGLSRIDSVLNSHKKADTVIIMEGTNDVSRIARGELSMESTLSNLEGIAAKVRAKAMVALYSTVIPRPSWAKTDNNNSVTFELVRRIRELSSTGVRPRAEPWQVFALQGTPAFKDIYCCRPGDPVGHPNAAGFDLLAQLFADRLLEIDNLAPSISQFTKTGSGTLLGAGDKISAVVHESGEGIVSNRTYFTLNGHPVDTTVSGSKRRIALDYQVSAKEIGCAARITVRTEDAANPPNVSNRTIAELGVAGESTIRGDVDGDCRVDGLDLSLMGLSFGSKKGEVNYSFFADTNNDDKVDGEDLARLARNFGKDNDS